MNKAAANASINGLEAMLIAQTGAYEDWARHKLDHAIDKAEVYARGVEGKNAEQRDAVVALATQDSATALLKADILLKSVQTAVEIQRLRVQVAMANDPEDMQF